MMEFRINRLDLTTTDRWRDHYTSEKTTYRTLVEAKSYLTCLHKLFELHQLPHRTYVAHSGLSDQLSRNRQDSERATRSEIRRLFAITRTDASNLTRFFRNYDPEDWRDPVRMAVVLPFNTGSPPTYMVYCVDGEERIVMSMMVVATESNEFQYHQYIFRSLAYLVHHSNNSLPSVGPLALRLNAYAGRMIGARNIVSLPKKNMEKILVSAGGRTPGSDAPEIEVFNREHHDFIWRYCVGPASVCLTNDAAFQRILVTSPTFQVGA